MPLAALGGLGTVTGGVRLIRRNIIFLLQGLPEDLICRIEQTALQDDVEALARLALDSIND